MVDYENVKEWLGRHVHSVIKNTDLDNFNQMYEILRLHPKYDQWKHQTPEWFRITRSPKKKALQVFVKFENSKRERIVSWVDCTNRYREIKHSHERQLTQAMRSAIAWQMSHYRQTNGPQICGLCGSLDNIEVDHFPNRFAHIKKNFLASLTDTPPESFDWNPRSGRYLFKKADSLFEQNWSDYHLSNATYRFLCSTCNQRN